MSNLYNNPIITGFNPDPSIIRVKDDFFLVTSSFEYFPGAPIYHSTDLIRWSLIGHALTRPSQIQIHTPEPGGGIWATTLRYHQGVFYIIAASFERYRPQEDDRVFPRGFYVKTENIWDSDSWSNPVFFDEIGFDQDDFAIHITTIDLPTGNSTSEPKLIRESSSGVAEGSHIFKRGKYYYLFTAEGGTESGHSEWVSRSERGPFGPWELGPGNPLWRNGVEDEVQNTGHADLVEDREGRWWAVFLGVRPVWKDGYWEESVFGRETFLVPVGWKDDWPVFNGGQKITLQSNGPGLYQFEPPLDWRDDFSTPSLQLGWYRKNTPVKLDYSLTEHPNHLRLYGGPYNLSTPACPTLFLRKQTHRSCIWETRLSFHPTSPNVEAGTVIYWNYFTYSSIGIRLSPTNNSKRIIRFRHAEGELTEQELSSPQSEVVFIIECGDSYRLGFKELDEIHHTTSTITWIGEVSNSVMTKAPPSGAPFSGMMLGLYSFGERQLCLTPADFEYAMFR